MKVHKIISVLLVIAILLSTAVIGMTATAAEDLPFDDVPAGKWYTGAVSTVYSEGIMQGKAEGKFDPLANITRAEVVTAFSRIACVNIEGKGDSLSFTDTKSGKWYSDSVGWAADNGIVKGRGDGRFSPSDNITRAELASIIVNFTSYMELDLPDNSKLSSFADADTFAKWMKAPIEEVRRNGLMQGSDGKFNPTGTATRAEIAQVIANLLPSAGRMTVSENGATEYIIVIDSSDDAALSAADRLVWQFECVLGAEIGVVDHSVPKAEHEIVIGKTNRGEKISTDGLTGGSYEILSEDGNIFIDAADEDGLYRGAVRLVNSYASGEDLRLTARSGERVVFSEYPIGKLTVDGNDISKYKILYPQGASEDTMAGVMDLVKYIEKACGVKLPASVGTSGDYAIIVKEAEVKVGGSANDSESFSVKSEGTSIVLTGSAERGAMYACYDFLEDVIGWCFINEETDYLEPTDELDIKGLDYAEAPVFEHRVPYNTVYLNDDRTTENEISDKHKMASMKWVANLHFAHTFQPLSDWEYDQSVQPCLSDPKVYDTMLKNVLNYLRADPDAKLISVTQNDNMNYCKCNSCQTTYEKYTKEAGKPEAGGTAGQMLEFVNRIADEVAKEFPDVYVVTFAYMYTRHAPKDIVPRDNVMVQLCSLECCFGHPLNGADCNREFAADMNDWAAISNNLYIWDYNTNYGFRGSVFPNVSYEVLAGNMKFFADNSALGVFSQGNDVGEINGEFDDLRWYLIAKLLWDPYMTEEEYDAHVIKFMKGYYGEGWEKVYETLNSFNESCDQHMGIYENVKTTWMTIKLASASQSFVDLMEEAKRLTETKTAFERVDRSELQFDYLLVSCNFDKMYNSGDAAKRAEIVMDSFALQEKFQKYGVKYSSGYPIPELTEITKAPYDWKDLIDEQMNR